MGLTLTVLWKDQPSPLQTLMSSRTLRTCLSHRHVPCMSYKISNMLEITNLMLSLCHPTQQRTPALSPVPPFKCRQSTHVQGKSRIAPDLEDVALGKTFENIDAHRQSAKMQTSHVMKAVWAIACANRLTFRAVATYRVVRHHWIRSIYLETCSNHAKPHHWWTRSPRKSYPRTTFWSSPECGIASIKLLASCKTTGADFK